MRKVDNNGSECFYSFYTTDMPIHNKQLITLRDELQEHFDNYATDFNRWVWDTCEGVCDDGYGSFRFEWPAEVMNFMSEDQRQIMEEVVNNVVNDCEMVIAMSYVHAYQEGDAEIETENDIEYYLDSIINAGYNVCDDDADIVPANLLEAFNVYMAQLKLSQEVA